MTQDFTLWPSSNKVYTRLLLAEKDVPEHPLITTMIPDSTDKIDRVTIVIHQEDINRSHISGERNK